MLTKQYILDPNPKGHLNFRSDGGGCWSYIGQVSFSGSGK